MSEVTKGWGKEVIFVSTPDYCGKFLEFSKAGNKFSMHFHAKKDETWVVLKGSFNLKIIDTSNSSITDKILRSGDVWRNLPLVPHQLEALEDGSMVVEVSTHDDPDDNYRVMPGDSQEN